MDQHDLPAHSVVVAFSVRHPSNIASRPSLVFFDRASHLVAPVDGFTFGFPRSVRHVLWKVQEIHAWHSPDELDRSQALSGKGVSTLFSQGKGHYHVATELFGHQFHRIVWAKILSSLYTV